MRILLLTTLVPAGPLSGGSLVLLDLNRALESHGVVERWAVWTYDAVAPENQRWHGARSISLAGLRRHRVLHGLRRVLPLSVSRFYRTDVAKALAGAGAFDLFVAAHLGAWQYRREVAAKRGIICTYDVESEIYERAISLERSPLKRLVWRYEAHAMARYESSAYRSAEGVICLGVRDQALLAARYGVHAHPWYPSIVGARPVRPKRARGQGVGVVGSMTWQPNRWGMDWFVAEVWPLVRRQIPHARLRIAGGGSDRLPYRAESGIERLGPVNDIEAFYESVDVVIAPIRGGAGIKLKVMDAAARGLPVVTTSWGIEGLGMHVPSGIGVAEDAEQFAECVATFLKSSQALPLEENVAWYHNLVVKGSQAIEAAVRGVAPPPVAVHASR